MGRKRILGGPTDRRERVEKLFGKLDPNKSYSYHMNPRQAVRLCNALRDAVASARAARHWEEGRLFWRLLKAQAPHAPYVFSTDAYEWPYYVRALRPEGRLPQSKAAREYHALYCTLRTHIPLHAHTCMRVTKSPPIRTYDARHDRAKLKANGFRVPSATGTAVRASTKAPRRRRHLPTFHDTCERTDELRRELHDACDHHPIVVTYDPPHLPYPHAPDRPSATTEWVSADWQRIRQTNWGEFMAGVSE